MKIVLVHPHDVFSVYEPWTVRIREFANEMSRAGHSVKLAYFPLAGQSNPAFGLDPEVEVMKLRRLCGPLNLVKNTFQFFRFSRGADVIHFQKCFYHAAVPALISAYCRLAHLHYDWDDWETRLFSDGGPPPSRIVHWFMNFMERTLPKLATTVSGASARIRQELEDLGIDRKRIVSAPVGVDLKVFCPNPENGARMRRELGIKHECVLYCGQLHGGQYAKLLLDAATILIPRFPKIKIVFVGGGHRLEELRRSVRVLGLDSHVITVGFVAHERVPDYMNMADVAVACFEDNDITRSKSPLKIAEYMACAKALVASRVGEVEAMTDGGRAAVLVEPGSGRALAEGITQLLADKDKRQSFEEAARSFARNRLAWKHTAGRLLDAYSCF